MPAPVDLPATVVETHVSTLFFVGDRVFKLKKPVAFPFVDLTRREERERICHREVELNRRLAPDVYQGVADLVGPDGAPWDHLVVMRRLPEERRLSRLVREHDPAAGVAVDQVAELLARFHAGAPRSPRIDAAGRPEALLQRWDDLFDEVAPAAGRDLAADDLRQARRLAHRYVAGRGPLLAGRVEQGAVCDGHGDLQADDVFCLDDGPRVLDCVEFDDRLRHVDVADDVAFLAMDLVRLDAPALARQLVRAYESAAGSTLPPSLVDFFIAYRAMVRGMVAWLRGTQSSGGEAEAAMARARSLLELCTAHLRLAVPTLVMVGGAPGTGKSTLARGIGEASGWEVVRSDVVRKVRAGLEPTRPVDAAYQGGLYEPSTTAAVYEELATRARALLEDGRSVIVDASFTTEDQRRGLRDVAGRTASELVELRCVLAGAEADRRMRQRAAAGDDPSDATPDVARRMLAAAQPWPQAVEVSTAGPPVVALERALARLPGSRRSPSG